MPKAQHVQAAFNGGEWSPSAIGRSDVQKYQRAVSTMKNCYATRLGPVVKRSGTRFVAETKDSSKESRLIEFRPSPFAGYVLEFGDTYIRFYVDEGQITSGMSPLEISSPYGEDDLEDLKFTQSADILYVCHPDYATRELRRTSTTPTFELTEFDFRNGPYLPENTNEDHGIQPDSTTGPEHSITAVDTGNDVFTVSGDQSSDVQAGDLIRVIGSTGNDGEYTVDSVNVTASPDTEITVEGDVTDSTADGDLRLPAGVTATKDTFASSDATDHRHLRIFDDRGPDNGWGWGKIVEVTDAKNARVIVHQDYVGTGDTFHRWRLGAWGDENLSHPVESASWPWSARFHKGRLWFGGSNLRPQTLWGSVVNDYSNFTPTEIDDTVLADNGMTLALDADQIQSIRWMLSSATGLVIGTDSGEWALSSGGVDEQIEPDNYSLRMHSNRGSHPLCRSAQVGPAIVFIQPSGQRMRELIFDFQMDSFQTPDMTLLANHLTQESPIKQIAYQPEPESFVWALRQNGTLIAMTRERDEEIFGWHRHVIGGTDAEVESIVGIRDLDTNDGDIDGKDQIWLIVKRTVDGGTKRYVEFIENDFPLDGSIEDAFFVDSGLTYSGSATTTISGLDHLEGEEVSVLADGSVVTGKTVSSGEIELDSEAEKVHVGLAYEAEVETLPLIPTGGGMDPRGRVKNLGRAIFHLLDTQGIKAGTGDTTDFVLGRDPATSLGDPEPLVTQFEEVRLPQAWDREPQVKIVSDVPLPMTIRMLTVDLGIEGL